MKIFFSCYANRKNEYAPPKKIPREREKPPARRQGVKRENLSVDKFPEDCHLNNLVARAFVSVIKVTRD
jgi:hypothetical protein